jgi:hypothetical protein
VNKLSIVAVLAACAGLLLGGTAAATAPAENFIRAACNPCHH